jgi:hypothetical protein
VKRGIGIVVAGALATVVGLSGVASGAGGCAACSASASPVSAAAAITFVTGTRSAKPTVWVADAHGHNARSLGPGQEPLISPNGKYVAANLFNPHTAGVVIYNTSGGVAATFLDGGNPLAWSSDSRYLAISVFDSTANQVVGKSKLAVVDMTTLKTTVIAHALISGASFKPDSSDTLVYGVISPKAEIAPPSNLYTADPSGTSAPVQLTHDNNSLDPLWTKRGIVYDRQRKRKEAPEYQLYLLHGGHSTQITNIKVDQLSEGLVPVAASADGTKVAAEYGGTDNSEGWAVNVVTHKAKEIATPRNGLEDAGISRNGKTLLVDLGVFGGDPSNKGTIATVPFGGGTPKKLVVGNEPTWNQ